MIEIFFTLVFIGFLSAIITYYIMRTIYAVDRYEYLENRVKELEQYIEDLESISEVE